MKHAGEPMDARSFAVDVVDTGEIVWVGTADDALSACARAAREGNPNVGPFAPYYSSTEDDYDLRHLVLNVYDVSALGEHATLVHLQANTDELDENRLVGTFAARYED
jgi:hypothetical protein